MVDIKILLPGMGKKHTVWNNHNLVFKNGREKNIKIFPFKVAS